MGRRDRDEGGELPRVYEGQEVLAELLAIAGSKAGVDEVKELFREALATQQTPSSTFPELFEAEPRFPSPELARRLYGNLFGLWSRVARGILDEPRGQVEKPQEPEPVPPPQPIAGAELPDDFVEAAFAALTTLPAKERQRQRDRFEQRESDLVEVIRQLHLAPEAELAGVDLAFELWLICTWALADRVGRTDFSSLRAPAPKGAQPALERYVAEWLAEAEVDEEEPLSAEDRARLEPVLRAAAELLAPVPAGG